TPRLYQPDIFVVDLDPSVEDLDVLRQSALQVRDLLDEVGLPSWVKTSGSKGFHIVAPLDSEAGYEDVLAFTNGLAEVLVRRHPKTLTLEFTKAERGDRIYVDVGRNGWAATFAAAYTVRPKPGAPVSAPCTWQEIERGEISPQTFT